jgi:hypothetical protein
MVGQASVPESYQKNISEAVDESQIKLAFGLLPEFESPAYNYDVCMSKWI